MDGSRDGGMYAGMEGWMNGCRDRGMDGWMDELIYLWMRVWIVG